MEWMWQYNTSYVLSYTIMYVLLRTYVIHIQTQALYLKDWALGPTVVTVDLSYNDSVQVILHWQQHLCHKHAANTVHRLVLRKKNKAFSLECKPWNISIRVKQGNTTGQGTSEASHKHRPSPRQEKIAYPSWKTCPPLYGQQNCRVGLYTSQTALLMVNAPSDLINCSDAYYITMAAGSMF